ncbi:hypothetical protein L6164_001144 [Bauhinia variegata]|uniref:Uncharacterized protein n=1 Tax=Bauhinia variegata TaxID=167791 RepID=A0ACB9Q8P4_BAUVA|nr:hypothetical protein L6164_001144 [Bauhinia variegata]
MQDSICSVRNAVRFVRSSPSRLAKFKDCVNFANLPSKGLVCLDVPSRWNSTYLMLEAALRFQAAFEKLEDDDRSYVEHFGELGPPSALNWLNANVFLKILKIFYDATMILSGTLHITANSAFHQLALILIELNTWCVADDSLLRGMTMEMKEKYDKYWGNVQNINPIIYFGVIFDPRYKIKFIEWAFEKMYSDDVLTRHDMYIRIKNMLSKLYSWYSMAYEQGKKSTQESSSQGSQSEHGGTVKSVLQGQRIGTLFHQDAQLWAPVKEVDAREIAVAARDCSRLLQVHKAREAKIEEFSILPLGAMAPRLCTVAPKTCFRAV